MKIIVNVLFFAVFVCAATTGTLITAASRVTDAMDLAISPEVRMAAEAENFVREFAEQNPASILISISLEPQGKNGRFMLQNSMIEDLPFFRILSGMISTYPACFRAASNEQIVKLLEKVDESTISTQELLAAINSIEETVVPLAPKSSQRTLVANFSTVKSAILNLRNFNPICELNIAELLLPINASLANLVRAMLETSGTQARGGSRSNPLLPITTFLLKRINNVLPNKEIALILRMVKQHKNIVDGLSDDEKNSSLHANRLLGILLTKYFLQVWAKTLTESTSSRPTTPCHLPGGPFSSEQPLTQASDLSSPERMDVETIERNATSEQPRRSARFLSTDSDT